MALGTILGIASFASGAMSSIAGHNAESARVAASNAYRKLQYKMDKAEYKRKTGVALNRYKLKTVNYKRQLENNKRSFENFQSDTLRGLNQKVAQSRVAGEAMEIQKQRLTGAIAARNVTGKSASRLSGATLAQFGRNQAIMQQNLRNQVNEANIGIERGRRALNAANEAAYTDVAFAPTFGPGPVAPMMESGPSSLGLFGNLLGNAVSAAGTASSLTPEGQGINKLLGI